MSATATPNHHADLRRFQKVAACLGCLDRKKNALGSTDRDLLRFVADFDDAKWEALAAEAGVPRLSEASRDLLVHQLRRRLP